MPEGPPDSAAAAATAERAAAVARTDASLRAEGLEPTPEAVADGEAYIRGEISVEELEARAAARVRVMLDDWS